MKTQIIGLFAETSIHAGAGSSTGIIDLPIMRESHTNYPCIFGSALKGSIRAKAEQMWSQTQKELVQQIFGSEANEIEAWASAFMVSDARIIWLPVRSLNGHFKLVTCPYILQRWQRDQQRQQATCFEMPEEIKQMASDESQKCLVAQQTKHSIYLEEFQYDSQILKNPEPLIKALQKLTPIDYDIQDKLCIISNEQFAHLSTIATAVTPHIAIDNINKTVKAGALWYEETLPADTLFYTLISTESVRKKDHQKTDAEVWAHIQQIFQSNPYLQVGGGETVGMGWMQLTAINEQENNA